jgi:hypothetical protein
MNVKVGSFTHNLQNFIFANYLSLIKQHYYTPKKIGASINWVSKSLLRVILDLQTFFFKLTMKNQASKAMAKPKMKT